MQVTSSRNMEAYIFASLVLPLKNLDVPQLEVSSPISDKAGNTWQLYLTQIPISRSFRRRYQRELAERSRDWQITLEMGMDTVVLGEYNIKNHFVKLYENEFRDRDAMILLGKMCEVFDRNSPFTKVIVENRKTRKRVVIDDEFGRFDTIQQPQYRPNRYNGLRAAAERSYDTVAADDSDEEDYYDD